MAKMVLIEAHPLLRLGLWQILSKLDDVWEIEGMGLADVSKADGVHAGADLLIYGLPVDTDEAWSALHEIQRVLTPKRILLLTDVMPLPMPVQGLPGASVYGCLMKTASVEILEAAIRLVMAGGQCFPSEQALQAPASTVCALPSRDVEEAGSKGTMPVSAGAQLLQITPRQYEVLVLLGASMSLVPYLFSAGYGALLALRGDTYAGQRGLRARDLLVAGLATLYALWLVYAGGLSQVLLSVLLYAPGIAMFAAAKHQHGQRMFTRAEQVIVAGVIVVAGWAAWGLYQGHLHLA